MSLSVTNEILWSKRKKNKLQNYIYIFSLRVPFNFRTIVSPAHRYTFVQITAAIVWQVRCDYIPLILLPVYTIIWFGQSWYEKLTKHTPKLADITLEHYISTCLIIVLCYFHRWHIRKPLSPSIRPHVFGRISCNTIKPLTVILYDFHQKIII